jgi:hypothetical protein
LTATGSWIRRDGRDVTRAPAGDVEPLVEHALRHGGGLVLLGVFGSGKTEIARRVGARLGVPVVPLRVVARAADPEAMLDALVGGSEAAILDGLDEIGRPDDTSAPELFARVTRRVSRWVVTSRPGHVRTDAAEPDPGQVDCFHLPLLELSPYEVPPDAPTFCAESAVLLSLWLRGARGDTPAALVEGHLAATGQIEALEALAWSSLVDDERHEGGSFRAEDLQGLPAWLFVEDLDGRYRFGHRSLYDALVARRLARLLEIQGPPDAITGLAISGAMRTFLAGNAEPWPVDARWMYVPRGNFVRGGARGADERPILIAHLAEPVRIARRPVTNAEFAAFLAATGPRPRWLELLSHWRGPTCPAHLLDHPVQQLRPEDCDAYAAWAGGRFPWGDRFDAARANTAESGREGTCPVDTFPQGGLYGAIGDAFECTTSYYRDRQDRGRVVMGGAYTHEALRASLRPSHTLSGRFRIGLRVAEPAS